jgi:chromosome segregation ATPase
MTVTAEREGPVAEWSDGRLDEFAIRVDERFDRAEEKTDERFDRAEQRAGDRFAEVDRRFDKVDRQFDEVDRRFDAVDRRLESVDRRLERDFGRINDRLDDLVKAMIAAMVTLTGAILAGFAALVVLFSTQF